MPTLDDFSSVARPNAARPSSPLDAFSTVTAKPEPKPFFQEIAEQFPQGFNEWLDATYNLPSTLVNAAYMGDQRAMNAIRRIAEVPEKPVEQLIEPAQIATRFNDPNVQPTRAVGRYARAIGQQVGGAMLPAAGLVAGGLMPATGRAMAQLGASTAGAGVAGEVAKEAGVGPTGQLMAQVAGGFGGPALYNIGRKFTTDIPKAVGSYGSRVMEEARNPQLGADRDLLDLMRKSKVDLEQLRAESYPKFPRGSNLPARGFDDDDLSNIILRRIEGESADDIARDYAHLVDAQGHKLTAKTVDDYVRRFHEANPTPMNLMDLAQEQVGYGAVQPLLRGARQKMIAANTAEPAARLYNRQLQQPARMGQAFERSLPSESTVVEADAAQKLAGEEAIAAIDKEFPGRYYQAMRPQLEQKAAAEMAERYQALWAQEAVPLDDELARILGDPLGESAYRLAMRRANREGIPIPSYDELMKLFGLRRNPGLGLDVEGFPQPAPQFPHQPPVKVPVAALDYFQRALRRSAKAGYTAGNPEAADFNTLRQQLLDHLDPRIPGEPVRVPGFRQILSDYHANMVDEEAMDLAAALTLKDEEKTIRVLQEFDKMPPSARELFKLRFARSMESIISNRPYSADPLEPFRSRSAELIMRHVFGDGKAAKMMTGLESARRTGLAMKWGEDLAFNLGNANTRKVLFEFRHMTPEQKKLALRGLSTKVHAALGQKGPGKEVALQFNTPNAHAIFKGLMPKKEADALIKIIEREVITTGGKNFIFGGPHTAQTLTDISTNEAQQAAKAAAHLSMGKLRSFYEDVADWLRQQISAKRATILMQEITETNPADRLRTLDRLIEMAPTVKERDALRVLRDWGAWGPSPAWRLGETVGAGEALEGIARPEKKKAPPAGYPHARQAADGSWYIPDPRRPGAYARVAPAGTAP